MKSLAEQILELIKEVQPAGLTDDQVKLILNKYDEKTIWEGLRYLEHSQNYIECNAGIYTITSAGEFHIEDGNYSGKKKKEKSVFNFAKGSFYINIIVLIFTFVTLCMSIWPFIKCWMKEQEVKKQRDAINALGKNTAPKSIDSICPSIQK